MATNKKSFIGVFDKNNVNKFYNIYTSDASISELKKFASLPANALIISSPISQGVNSYDLGTPAIVMTDTYGTPVSLTYTFSKDIFSFNEETNTVGITDINYLQKTIDDLKNEVEKLKGSTIGNIEYKFKQLCSSKAILDNNDNTSTVSFIDNTTYSLKLEKWTNQTLSVYQKNIGKIIIPGPTHLINNYVFAYYGNTVECSICLGYYCLDDDSFNLAGTTYSKKNNNCIDYIKSYSLMNRYDGNINGNSFLTVSSSKTGLVMNDIIGVGDSKKYIVTKPIFGTGNTRVGSYTFLKFPTESLLGGESRRIKLQVKEGNNCVASNISEMTIEWKCDEHDLPTVGPTQLPTTPLPTPSPTYS